MKDLKNFPGRFFLSIYEDLKKKCEIMENLDEEILNQLTEEEEIINEIIYYIFVL
jgi:hypothetical protein